MLADRLASSVTPVRDALHLLVGEGLVAARTGEGFHLPQITEPELRDLYAWNAQVLALALRDRTPPDASPRAPPGEQRDGAVAAADLFKRIAARSRNGEHLRTVIHLNDRLWPARLVEPIAMRRNGDEIAAMTAAFDRDDAAGLRAHVAAYHRRRGRAAAEVVRALYRAELPDPGSGDGNNRRTAAV